jgi:hypothetical protein
MSYLRGPATREQIAALMATQKAAIAPAVAAVVPEITSTSASTGASAGVSPPVAKGVPTAYVDPAATWWQALDRNGDGTVVPAAVARVEMVFDDTKSQLREVVEWEAAIYPLSLTFRDDSVIEVDYDDRDLQGVAPADVSHSSADAPVDDAKWWTQLRRDLTDHLVRHQTHTVQRNMDLKMYSRPNETDESFANRCKEAAHAAADAETAKLRDKYEAKVARQQATLDKASDRVEVADSEAKARKGSALLSTAGSLLGGLLGGRSGSKQMASVARSAGGIASRAGTAATAGERLKAARNRLGEEQQELAELETQLADEIDAIVAKWEAVAETIDSIEVALEKTDVKVTDVALVWIPVG